MINLYLLDREPNTSNFYSIDGAHQSWSVKADAEEVRDELNGSLGSGEDPWVVLTFECEQTE